MRKVIIIQPQLTNTHNCSPGGIITGVILGNDNFLHSDKTRVFARETPHCQTHVLKLRALSRVRVIYLWEKSLFVMYITLSNEAKKMFHKQHEINLQKSIFGEFRKTKASSKRVVQWGGGEVVSRSLLRVNRFSGCPHSRLARVFTSLKNAKNKACYAGLVDLPQDFSCRLVYLPFLLTTSLINSSTNYSL